MDSKNLKQVVVQREQGWEALFSKYEKLQNEYEDEDSDSVYSLADLTDNDSHSESDEEDDDDSDAINSVDECDEAPENEPNDKVLHDIDPNMFLQQFRTMCQRKIQTWEKYREHNIVEYTKTKDERKKRRESIIDTSKRSIQEENITTGAGSMTPLKSNMKALAIEPAAKNYGTPNRQIQNQSMDWEKSRNHKTKDVTKRPNSITEEINSQSTEQFGKQMRKYVKQDVAAAPSSFDDDDDDDDMQQFVTVNTKKAIKSNGVVCVNGMEEEVFETVTTTTTTTTVKKKIRRVSTLPAVNNPMNTIDSNSDISCDDSEPCLAGTKRTGKKRYNVIDSDNDDCPITPKKSLSSSQHKTCSMESSRMNCSIVVPTPRRSAIISKKTIERQFLANCSHIDGIDTSDFRDIHVKSDERLRIAPPKLNTPDKRSKLLAIDQTPHKKVVEEKKDILKTILCSPRTNKPIIIREK